MAQYDSYTHESSDVWPRHFNRLLLGLLLLMLPALALLYVSTRFHIRMFYLGALWLNLFLLACAAVVVVISGIKGAIEQRKYDRLAHPNTHPRPRQR